MADVAPTELGKLLRNIFYKHSAPLALSPCRKLIDPIVGIRRSPGQRLEKSRQVALFVIGERERVQVPFAIEVLPAPFVIKL